MSNGLQDEQLGFPEFERTLDAEGAEQARTFAEIVRRQREDHYSRMGFDVGDVTVLGTSPSAVRVQFDDLNLPPAWIYKSDIHLTSEVPAKSNGVLVVTRHRAVALGAYESVPTMNGALGGRMILKAAWRARP